MRGVRIGAVIVLAVPLGAAVVTMAGRVSGTARFVTWPIVAFTVLAAGVSLVGLWAGLDRPLLLAAGVVPSFVFAYFLPAAPVVAIVVVLIVIGALAVRVDGIASGLAMTVGALMVVFVVLQGPAVECHDAGVSSGSGPWWVPSASSSSGSGSSSTRSGEFHGTTQVGKHHYAFTCRGGRLEEFERVGKPG